MSFDRIYFHTNPFLCGLPSPDSSLGSPAPLLLSLHLSDVSDSCHLFSRSWLPVCVTIPVLRVSPLNLVLCYTCLFQSLSKTFLSWMFSKHNAMESPTLWDQRGGHVLCHFRDGPDGVMRKWRKDRRVDRHMDRKLGPAWVTWAFSWRSYGTSLTPTSSVNYYTELSREAELLNAAKQGGDAIACRQTRKQIVHVQTGSKGEV